MGNKRNVIVHQGALGDFLLALPVLHGLHQRFSMCFDLWTRPQHGEIVQALPFVGTWHTSECKDLIPFYHDDLWENAPIPPFFQRAQTVFFLGQDSLRPTSDRLSRRLPCPVRWVRSFPKEHIDQSVPEFVADQFASLGFPAKNIPVRLNAPPQALASLQARLAELGLPLRCRPVVLHPGSGGRKKIWPLGKWRTLMEWIIRNTHEPIIVLLGPADSHLIPLGREAENLGAFLLHDLPLTEALALLNQGNTYVGNDSGMSHLAGVSGIEAIVVFGPTNPKIWAPQGSNVQVVKTHWNEGKNLEPDSLRDDVAPDVKAIQNLLMPLLP